MFFDNASKPYDTETTKTEKSSMEIYIGSNDSQHERFSLICRRELSGHRAVAWDDGELKENDILNLLFCY